jgi:hypothetical protein
MNAIKELKSKLTKYPHIQSVEYEDSIEILPESSEGFKIMLEKNSSGYTVSFEGWHESFESPEEALDCVGFGLSNSCRLQIIMRGSFPQKWILESKRNGEWVPDSETGLIIFPFWRKKTILYKQNLLIKDA